LVVDKDEEWNTILKLAHSAMEVKAGAGTKYTHADILSGIRIANHASQKGIALVGVPCEMEGFTYFAKENPHLAEKVKLRVALLCTESFYHKDLYGVYLKGKGIEAKNIKKANIKKGKLIVWHEKDGEVVEDAWPVKDSDAAVHHGCFVCQDMMGLHSDISCGGVGSRPGFTTLFVRTDTGMEILKYMKKKRYIEDGDVLMKPLEYMVDYKIKIHDFKPGSKLMDHSL
ncbi:MAG: Coenzyme F420 hydrogenase/dehydrogenase, beta subunit C-terminal domain, partial [Candidatus Hydrothermarchaeales archaeon]